VGLASVRATDLFGLFRAWIRIEGSQEYKPLTLTIRPRIQDLPALPLPSLDEESHILSASRPTQDTAQVSDIRKAQTGDSIRRIHWKLTMRQREIMVKNYEYQSLSQTLLYLDASAPDCEGEDKLYLEDAAIEHAASIGAQILRRNSPMNLVYRTDYRHVVSGLGFTSFPAFYEAVSRMRFEGNFPFEDFLKDEIALMQHGGRVFLITHRLTQPLFNLLILLARGGIHLSAVLVTLTTSEEILRMADNLRTAGVATAVMRPGQSLSGEAGFFR